MVITDFLEKNARFHGSEIALVEINPTEERDNAHTWRESSLIELAMPDAPYRREMSWRAFDAMSNRFANFLLSRNVKPGTKVGMLLMNCLEFLPLYFGILKSGCTVVPLNYRYTSEEIQYCLDLADVEILIFGPEFVDRMDVIIDRIPKVHTLLFLGKEVPDYAVSCMRLMNFCSSSQPPVHMTEDDIAAIYFSSGTTGFPKAMLHRHRALVASCVTEQKHHGQTKDDVFLCIPPLYHTGAKMHWFGSLIPKVVNPAYVNVSSRSGKTNFRSSQISPISPKTSPIIMNCASGASEPAEIATAMKNTETTLFMIVAFTVYPRIFSGIYMASAIAPRISSMIVIIFYISR